MTAMVLISLIACLPFCAGSQAMPAQTVHWIEMDRGDAIHKSLKILRGGTETDAFVRMEFSWKSGGDTWTTVREDRHKNAWFAEYTLAIPIAVAGSDEPQVLVKMNRPNWTELVIYCLTEEGIVQSFGISNQGEPAVVWQTAKGRLVSFELFDKDEAKSDKLLRKEKPGYRWRLHSRFVFDGESSEWKAVWKRWEQYRFESNAPGKPILKPQDCSFRFKGT